MPIPLIAAAQALAAGGTLVPHAAGGLIVSSGGGYVAGTYLSTAAISGLISGAVVSGASAIGAGALMVSGLAGKMIGGAGLFGTTVGSSGIIGGLMSIGLLSSTPVWVPLAVGGAAAGGVAGLGYGAYREIGFRKKLKAAEGGEEVVFTEAEARRIERLLRRLQFSKNEAD